MDLWVKQVPPDLTDGSGGSGALRLSHACRLVSRSNPQQSCGTRQARRSDIMLGVVDRRAVWPPSSARSECHRGATFRSAYPNASRKDRFPTIFLVSLNHDFTIAVQHHKRPVDSRLLIAKAVEQRQHQDAQIEHQGPVGDVLQIEGHPLTHIFYRTGLTP